MRSQGGSWVFVVNPRSANGATLRRFDRVRSRFERALGDVVVRLTERPRHATEIARDAVRAGAKAVVSVGGDGTNNEVVNGFFDEDGAPLAGDTAFGVVTSGTGGDFRRAFRWSVDPLDDLARLVRFERRRIDVGRATYVGHDGRQERRFFVNISSFGLSGAVVDIVNHSSKALGAKASFLLGSLRGMASYRPQRVRISIDDGPAEELDVTLVALANGQYFGGGMWIAPDARADDGLLHAVVVEGGGLSFWARHGLRVYTGTHTALDNVRVRPCRRLVAEPVDARDPVRIDLDGEQPGCVPVTYEIVPGALPLLV